MIKDENIKVRLLLIISSLVFSFILAEILLRIIGISYLGLYKFDSIRGYAHRPNYSQWCRTEGEAFVRINSQGFRGPERSEVKDKNVFRIAVLGDSYVEAFQVQEEETFCALIEKRLEPNCSKQVEVLNFGVSGYGTTKELLTLKYRALDYSPDLVILAFLSGNDLFDNKADIHWWKSTEMYYGELNKDYKIFFIHSLKLLIKRSQEFVHSHSRVVQLILKTISEIEKRYRISKLEEKTDPSFHCLWSSKMDCLMRYTKNQVKKTPR